MNRTEIPEHDLKEAAPVPTRHQDSCLRHPARDIPRNGAAAGGDGLCSGRWKHAFPSKGSRPILFRARADCMRADVLLRRPRRQARSGSEGYVAHGENRITDDRQMVTACLSSRLIKSSRMDDPAMGVRLCVARNFFT